MTNLTEEELAAAAKKIAELDAARTPGEWIEGLYTNNVAVASPADAPILKEWVEKYRAGAAHLPNIRDIRYRRLVSVGGDYGSTFSPEPYAGEGMTKADQAFIAAAPLMAAVVKQLWDERASLPRLSVEEVAGVIRGEFIGRNWLSTPMGVMVHDITSAIRNNFPQLFKE